jgi:hypothetical protein
MNNIKEKVMENKILQSLLNSLNDKEKESTLIVINGLLDEMQGKADGLAKAMQEASKK